MTSNGASNYSEGISTTISGLDTDQQYAFAIWWEAITDAGCTTFDPGVLQITLDGDIYVYEDGETWDLVEICFTPSSSTIELEIENIGATLTLLVVDSPLCEDVSNCCPLELMVDEDELEVCPGEPVLLPAAYSNEEGSVSIEWTSDPVDGVDYLDDPTSINPTFTFPDDSNFDGGEYMFKVKVTDDNCMRMEELLIIVNQTEEPEFDFFVCELSDADVFPLESLNGYAGSWDGDFDFENYGGSTQDFVFNINPGQDNCLTEWIYPVYIESLVEIEPLGDLVYCILDDASYSLPELDEDLVGLWDVEMFVPSELGLGLHLYTFNPDLTQSCALPFEADVIVEDADSLNFDLPESYCAQNRMIALPDITSGGVPGIWENASIDISQTGTFTNVFAADSEDLCYFEFVYTYEVLSELEPTFDIQDSLCRSIGLVELDSSSTNGILGFFTPASINTDTITADSINFYWQSLDSNPECQSDTTITVYLVDEFEPEFDLPNSICINDPVFTLPNVSDNGISGEWNIGSIDASTLGPGILDLEFIPNLGQCASTLNIQIEIVDVILPEFDLEVLLCANEEPFDLPEISNNNIQGQWSLNTIDPQMIEDSLIVTFEPIDNNTSCFGTYQHSFYISDLIDPIFNLPDMLCSPELNFDFPTTSLNGITGAWNLSSIDIDQYEGEQSITNTFVPDDGSCYNEYNASLELVLFDDIEITVDQIQSCEEMNGTVTVFSNTLDLIFSVDDGNNWLNNSESVALPVGEYVIQVGNTDLSCIEEIAVEILSIEVPEISEVIITSEQTCDGNDGVLEILAQGNNLQYSIDGGLTWSDDNIFINLMPGDYDIIVRDEERPDCQDQSMASIIGFEVTMIIDFRVENPMSCLSMDGVIVIEAVGQNLEFSIDGGSTWQEENEFRSLSPGVYRVEARSQDDPNCNDALVIEIFEAFSFGEIVLDIVDADCDMSDGSVFITSFDAELEYSLDNGMNWQMSTSFIGLPSGDYDLLVRHIEYIDCDTLLSFFIDELECDCADLSVETSVVPVDCLNPASGSIVIMEILGLDSNQDFEIIWQSGLTGSELSNLSEGWYGYLINYGANCIHEDSAFVNTVEPVSFDLLGFDQDCDDLGSIEVINFSGGSGVPMYSIDGINFQENQLFANLTAQEYEVFVESLFNCNGQDSIVINDNSSLQVDIPDVLPITQGQSTTLNPLINQSTIDSFEWSPQEGILNPGELIAEVAPLETTIYTLTIYFGDCVETRTIQVEVISQSDIYLGDIFSPNRDGNNDYYFPQTVLNEALFIDEFSIYDRWGNLVFSNQNFSVNDPSQGWNGDYNQDEALQGVYVYMLKYRLNGRSIIKTGSVTLIR